MLTGSGGHSVLGQAVARSVRETAERREDDASTIAWTALVVGTAVSLATGGAGGLVFAALQGNARSASLEDRASLAEGSRARTKQKTRVPQ